MSRPYGYAEGYEDGLEAGKAEAQTKLEENQARDMETITVLEAKLERVYGLINEVLDNNSFAARMNKQPNATDSYGINALLLWNLKQEREDKS